MAATHATFEFKAGDDVLLEFTVTDEDGDPVNLTGATPRFSLSKLKSANAPLISTEDATATATITSAPTGVYRVAIDQAETEDLLGVYWFESEVEDSSGDINTVAEGTIAFSRNRLAA